MKHLHAFHLLRFTWVNHLILKLFKESQKCAPENKL
jgi:hypothetical protein